MTGLKWTADDVRSTRLGELPIVWLLFQALCCVATAIEAALVTEGSGVSWGWRIVFSPICNNVYETKTAQNPSTHSFRLQS